MFKSLGLLGMEHFWNWQRQSGLAIEILGLFSSSSWGRLRNTQLHTAGSAWQVQHQDCGESEDSLCHIPRRLLHAVIFTTSFTMGNVKVKSSLMTLGFWLESVLIREHDASRRKWLSTGSIMCWLSLTPAWCFWRCDAWDLLSCFALLCVPVARSSTILCICAKCLILLTMETSCIKSFCQILSPTCDKPLAMPIPGHQGSSSRMSFGVGRICLQGQHGKNECLEGSGTPTAPGQTLHGKSPQVSLTKAESGPSESCHRCCSYERQG